MKKIILPLLLSIFFHAAFAQEDEGVEIGATPSKKPKFKPLQTGRMAAEIQLPKENIMYVIDGVPFFEGNIPAINQEDIASIDILKEPLPRFGCRRGADKVIIITTKSKQIRTLVADRLSGQPVPNASIQLLFKQKNKPGKMIVADSAGYFTVDNKLLSRVAAVYVSSVGYQERILLKEDILNIKRNIQLEPKWRTADTVVVLGYNLRRRISCGSICRTRIEGNKLYPVKKAETAPASIFPNPVRKGNTINVVFTPDNAERVNMALISATGQQVYQTIRAVNADAVQTTIQLPNNIPAGIYMLAVTNEQGKPLFIERVVVE